MLSWCSPLPRRPLPKREPRACNRVLAFSVRVLAFRAALLVRQVIPAESVSSRLACLLSLLRPWSCCLILAGAPHHRPQSKYRRTQKIQKVQNIQRIQKIQKPRTPAPPPASPLRKKAPHKNGAFFLGAICGGRGGRAGLQKYSSIRDK